MKKRVGRQDAIRRVIRCKDVRTQRDLAMELVGLGYSCTQATVSRDIAEMGLKKLPSGKYVLAEDLHLQRMAKEFVVSTDDVANQVIIHTQPGTAPGVAAAIDAAELPDVMGTIAGNDTILAICRGPEIATATVRLFGELCKGRPTNEWEIGG